MAIGLGTKTRCMYSACITGKLCCYRAEMVEVIEVVTEVTQILTLEMAEEEMEMVVAVVVIQQGILLVHQAHVVQG